MDAQSYLHRLAFGILILYSHIRGKTGKPGKSSTKNENTPYRITDFAEAEQPRERLARLGPKSLSNAELLAILVRVGSRGRMQSRLP